MARKQNNGDPHALPTIWRVPDAGWELLVPVLAERDPPQPTGRPRTNPHAVLDTIIFRMRTGCHWNHWPQDFPDDRVVHSTFQRGVRLGMMEPIEAVVPTACGELGAVDGEWQAADGAQRKARRGA